MIEKKAGNVTLKISEQGAPVNVLIGRALFYTVHPMAMIPDFGPEVVAAIEDLRKPLAENECWGPDGERLRLKLRDESGVGIALLHCVGAIVCEGDIFTPSDPRNSVLDALRIWAEKERGRWTLQRDDRRVLILRDGKIGFGVSNSLGTSTNNPTPAWVRAKAQAEYEAMMSEKKPKKPSERMRSTGSAVAHIDEMYAILDELAEKVGGL